MIRVKYLTFSWIIIMMASPASGGCGVAALYHEARSEGYAGMVEVGNVIMNRVRSKHYPNTVCKVVKQHKQFSYYPTKINTYKDVAYMARLQPQVHSLKDWRLSAKAWNNVVNKKANIKFKQATHFHTTDVSPTWNKSMTRLGKYKSHIFYK